MSIKQFPGGIITKNPTAPTTASAKGIWTVDQVSNYVKQGIWPRTPGAPTIGTATAGGAGSGTATVTYTAPTDLGTGSITYTATSSPGGLTGTGASPITVSGLTGGTAYTFTVSASTPGGTGPASAASNSVTPPVLAIGDAYQGGFYAGQISTAGNGIADYNLVVGPIASAQSQLLWKNANTATTGAASSINGPQNTTDIVNDGNATTYPCAHFCNNLVTGGYSDWYMPAINELDICYFNLKPTTATNSVSFGVNAYAVPPRTVNYTTSNPAQTSAANFVTGTGAEAFVANRYWSSTSGYTSIARNQYFVSGARYLNDKTYNFRVRAVRRVAV